MRAMMALLALVWLPAVAQAQSPNPVASCQVRIEPIDFGDYSGLSRKPLLSGGRIEVRCIGQIVTPQAQLVLSPGNAGRFQERVLMNGAHRLAYNIYVDPARQVIAGDGTEGTSPLVPQAADAGFTRFRGGAVSAANVLFRFYGRIEPGQIVPAGEYTDQIRVTVEF